jgi:hypothetical protein
LYQAIDALTVLHTVVDALAEQSIPIDLDRIYVTGGSGGGNVTLMSNKLAPRTFTVAIDKCGMARLTDDIAYGLDGGSRLNAGYSRNPDSPRYLSPDAQTIRYVGHPDHVAAMKAMGATAKLFVVHGVDDDACLFVDAKEMVENMQSAGLDVVPVYLTKDKLDGEIFKSTGHSLGDRTRIVTKVADEYLKDSPGIGRTIEDMRMKVRYETPNGAYVVTYPEGRPLLTFVPKE